MKGWYIATIDGYMTDGLYEKTQKIGPWYHEKDVSELQDLISKMSDDLTRLIRENEYLKEQNNK